MRPYIALIALIIFTQACIPTDVKNTTSALVSQTPSFTVKPLAITSTPTPASTSVPTKTPSSTPTASSTASSTEFQTVQPRPTNELIATNLAWKIYVWTKPLYGYLDPNQRYQEFITPLGGQYPREQTPETAVTVAFSNYTQQIAYMLETPEHKLNLWLADLKFQSPASAWVDEDNLMGYSSVDDLLSIRWGPGDNFILLRNRPASGSNQDVHFWVIYAIKSSITTQLTGPCERIFISPQSNRFAVGCPIDENGFMVLEQDGTQWNTTALPQNPISGKDWVFSPDGRRVLYANEADEIFVINEGGQQIQLVTGYQGGGAGLIMKTLQWSRDGSKLLIYGNNETHCPFSTFAGRTPPCWQVFDPDTGNLIWYASDASGITAAISPDGLWVVMFHADYASVPIARWGAIYSTVNNSAAIIYNFVENALTWGD